MHRERIDCCGLEGEGSVSRMSICGPGWPRSCWTWLFCASVATSVLLAAPVSESTQRAATTKLPSKLDRYVSRVVRPSAADRTRLLNGEPITKLLDADASKEVAVFGAVWIEAPIRRYVEAVKDIENFERGAAFRVTKRISTPPRIEDFAQLVLPEEDLADLRTCRVGDCELKLGERPLQALRAEVNWNGAGAPAKANAVVRRFALRYVTGYLEGGNDRLAVYRDNARPTFVAKEFRAMVDEMPSLTIYWPNLRRYLLGYPRASLPNSTSFLYWQEAQFGLKPTIRINHLVIREGPDDTVVASKMLYASHYFWTAIELRMLIPDPSRGPGFWFVTVNRSRSDGLSGFTGLFVRRRVRSEAQNGALAALSLTKTMLESRR